MKLKKFNQESLRILLFSVTATVGLLIVETMIKNLNSPTALVASAFLYLIILAEVIFIKYKEENKTAIFYNRLLPSALYWGVIFFLFVNNQPSLFLPAAIIFFVTYTVLLFTIAFDKDNKKKEDTKIKTRYDFCSIVISFLWSYSITLAFGLGYISAAAFLGTLAGIYILFMALVQHRHAVSPLSLVAGLIALVLILAFSVVFSNLASSSLILFAFVQTYIYYLYVFFVSAYAEEEVDRYDFTEMALLGLLSVILVYYAGI